MKTAKRIAMFALIGFVCAGALSAQAWGRGQAQGMPPGGSRGAAPGGKPGNTQTNPGGRFQRMAVYEAFGLIYDKAKEAYVYNGKIAGFFVDELSLGTVFLSPGGEVHIKAVRDSTGKLTGITQLSANEYAAIIAELDAKIVERRKQTREWQEAMNDRMKNIRPDTPRAPRSKQPPARPSR
jgi:hypothetical protein